MYGEVIVTGILVSLLFQTLTQLSPAGLIVPGYLVLSLTSPAKIVMTLLVVFLTLGIYRLIARFTIIYGQRRFALMVLISLLVGWGISALPLSIADMGVIGYLIPGIIAKECDRQGTGKTLISLTLVTALTALICLLLGVSVF